MTNINLASVHPHRWITDTRIIELLRLPEEAFYAWCEDHKPLAQYHAVGCFRMAGWLLLQHVQHIISDIKTSYGPRDLRKRETRLALEEQDMIEASNEEWDEKKRLWRWKLTHRDIRKICKDKETRPRVVDQDKLPEPTSEQLEETKEWLGIVFELWDDPDTPLSDWKPVLDLREAA